MKQKYELVSIESLNAHECVSAVRVTKLRQEIQRVGYLKKPIVVDQESQVILDGHHRVVVLRQLGVQFVPVYFVNYESDTVAVYLRRKKLMFTLIKLAVVQMGLSGDTFPIKTTRHIIKGGVPRVKIALDKLRELQMVQ